MEGSNKWLRFVCYLHSASTSLALHRHPSVDLRHLRKTTIPGNVFGIGSLMSIGRLGWKGINGFLAQSLRALLAKPFLFFLVLPLPLCAAACSIIGVEEHQPDHNPDQNDGWYQAKADDESDCGSANSIGSHVVLAKFRLEANG